MEAKDLMVGDWVELYGTPTRWELEDYAKWHKEMERTDVFTFEPILLTEEMLEKNGWTSDKSNHTLQGCHTWRYRYERQGFDYTFIFKLDDYFAIESYDDRVYRLYETHYCRRWSVDKLQKTLRLCGFQELAKEFYV